TTSLPNLSSNSSVAMPTSGKKASRKQGMNKPIRMWHLVVMVSVNRALLRGCVGEVGCYCDKDHLRSELMSVRVNRWTRLWHLGSTGVRQLHRISVIG